MAADQLFSSSSPAETTLPPTEPSFDALLNRHWQSRLADDLHRYGPPVIFVVGATFNLLCLLVLVRPTMRTKSTFAYLTCLTIADTVFLCVNPLRAWMEQLDDDEPIMRRKKWVCITVNFMGGVSSHFSVWVLAMVTAERLFVIVNPLKGPLVCRRCRAYAAMAVLLLLVIILNLHVIWTFDLISVSVGDPSDNTSTVVTTTRCAPPDRFQTFGLDYWPWIDTTIYSLLPSVVMLSMNIVIIVRTRGAQKMRRAMSVAPGKGGKVSAGDDHARLTIMLLTLSFSFILTTTPISVFNIYSSVAELGKQTNMSILTYAELSLGYTLCVQLMWVNHGINFFLYCVTGQKFRFEFISMLRCGKMARKDSRYPRTSQTAMSTVSTSVVNRDRQEGYSMRPLPNKPTRSQVVITVNGNNEKYTNGSDVMRASNNSIVSSSDASRADSVNDLNENDVVLTGFKGRDEIESRA